MAGFGVPTPDHSWARIGIGPDATTEGMQNAKAGDMSPVPIAMRHAAQTRSNLLL